MRGGCIGAVLLLAGCAAAGSWTQADWIKPGADAAATAGEYRDCRATAATAVKTEADIDQDILDTRPGDLQRARLFRLRTEAMQERTRERAAAIIATCMRAKGFVEAR